MQFQIWGGLLLLLAIAGQGLSAEGAGTFRVATYNLENYRAEANETRPAKTPESKAKIRESLLAIKAQVVGLQELGTAADLEELRNALKRDGLDYPHWEFVRAWDTNVHLAVLSQFPIVGRRSHTNDSYLLLGRRFRVSRGFAEVDIQAAPNYRFTLINAQLKSRRAIAEADETEMREQEAALLREKIDARLAADPGLNLVVLGDLNNTKDARSTRTIIGRGRNALVDTRPAERNGDNAPSTIRGYDPRNISWTHYFGKEDTYSRIDYILLSKGMAREWVTNESYVLALPNWGIASDHRPVTATFRAVER